MSEKKQIELVDAKIYQSDNLILSGVNLLVKQGEFIFITGKVGTGKTSLLKTLHAELPLISGRGTVANFNLVGIKPGETALLRREIGVVFQDFRLLTDRSVFENLSFVLKATGWKDREQISRRIGEVLSRVEMTGEKDKMPHRLSGGEQQRIVIARALLNNPPILLADEPTGNLDPETSREILDLFIRLNKEGKTIVMASHEYTSLAQKTARTLTCANGSLTDSRPD